MSPVAAGLWLGFYQGINIYSVYFYHWKKGRVKAELAKQISVSSIDRLVKLKELKYSCLHFKPSLRIIVLEGERNPQTLWKEIHNPLESREEVT